MSNHNKNIAILDKVVLCFLQFQIPSSEWHKIQISQDKIEFV